MNMRHANNVAQIIAVAERLGPLCDRVVFLGGAVVGLLVTDRAIGDVRRTMDVDLVIEVVGLANHASMEEELKKLGFAHDLSENAPTCRYIVAEISVDIMPLDGENWGFDMTWYPRAVKSAQVHELTDPHSGRVKAVRIINPCLFLATKIAAYNDRGTDFASSDDIADIIHVVNGRAELTSEMASENVEVINFIAQSVHDFLSFPAFFEAIGQSLLPDEASQLRESVVIERFRALVNLQQPEFTN